jgi:pimeloyl-ACP methyl ester carboxylesterase
MAGKQVVAMENHTMSIPTERVQSYRPLEALLPPHWTQATVAANGIEHFYYRTGGAKPPVVLLHGFLDGALTWLRTARALEPDFDVILIDARGHGRSDRITTGFTQPLLTADAAGVLQALNLEPVRLLGHSQGAATAVHVADEYPYLVHLLILEGAAEQPNPSADFTTSPGYQAWFKGYLAWLEQLKTETHAERMRSALAQLPPGAPIPPEEDYVAWVDNCAHLDLDLVRLGMSLWADLGQRVREMEGALARVNCPVLILKSGFFPQPNTPPTVREEPSDRPNVQVIRFENAGHLIHQECFDDFIAWARRFLQQ